MIVKELINELQTLKVPDDAIVFIEADHGQNKERANEVVVSRWPKDHEHFGNPDAMIFEWGNWREVYDEDAIEDYDETAPITAVLITY